jgi:hypothetical protein
MNFIIIGFREQVTWPQTWGDHFVDIAYRPIEFTTPLYGASIQINDS